MKRSRKWGDIQALWFALPAMLPLTVFWLIPMVYIIYLSMTDWDLMSPVKTFVGFDNYTYLFKDPEFYQSLQTTLIFTAGSVIPTMIGGLLLALLLSSKLAGSGLYRAIIFSPWVTPTVAVSIVWAWIFEPRSGMANAILSGLGMDTVPWLQDSVWAMVAILIVTIWKGIGWVMVFYLVALQSVPDSLREAAQVDGAGRITCFFKVTLPLLSPTTFFLFIIQTIDSLQAYDQINILTQGGPAGSTRTVLYLYYQAAFDQFNVGQASAVALLLVVFTALFSLASMWMSRRSVHYLS
ncbi:sugar ABC transporter permease [Paenibacillus sp. YPG26]|uniref:carbohydrate ABC transporter permease n=1 Tax=Paenibacillus sp. YPG26 TaxID=2878915 RepID=UPI0020403F2F|nr:sugar ABC transporter permease [Paenibacillus sp. YPG26]USB34988.1 sugar ABC transporter permease [Paenibacillus sp. YPG26]